MKGGSPVNVETLSFEQLDETLVVHTHSSGMKTYVLPKKGYYKKFAAFGTNYGAVDSEFVPWGSNQSIKVPDGVAHFLEHKLFEQKDGNVMDKFAALGASPNAYTSFHQTVYWFTCTENFQKSFELLLDYVQNPYITEESVEREKGIIGQEINMYLDDPNWNVYFNLLNNLFVQHPAKKNIIGTQASINGITKDILYQCFQTFYHPSNMVMIVGGDVDPDEVFRAVEQRIQITEKAVRPKTIFPEEPDMLNKTDHRIQMEISIPLFYMGYKELPLKLGDLKKGLSPDELFKREVAMKLILEMVFGKSSTIYRELYEKGLIDGTFGYDYTLWKDYGYSMIGGESKDPNAVMQRVLEEVERLNVGGLSEQAFLSTKKMFRGKFLRGFNTVEKPCRAFMSDYFKERNVFLTDEIVRGLNFDFVGKVFSEHFDPKKLALSQVMPLKGA